MRKVADLFGRLYRANILLYLQKDLLQELEWLNTIAIQNIKNFQIWYLSNFKVPLHN